MNDTSTWRDIAPWLLSEKRLSSGQYMPSSMRAGFEKRSSSPWQLGRANGPDYAGTSSISKTEKPTWGTIGNRMRRTATTFARAQVAVCHWFNPSTAHQASPQLRACFCSRLGRPLPIRCQPGAPTGQPSQPWCVTVAMTSATVANTSTAVVVTSAHVANVSRAVAARSDAILCSMSQTSKYCAGAHTVFRSPMVLSTLPIRLFGAHFANLVWTN
jgi:hypothetical protein